MQAPQMFEPVHVADQTTLLGGWVPVPGLGLLPSNAYLIHAREPVLVDTNIAAFRSDFIAALEGLIDPADLRWIWITHMDPDHVGNLAAVLARAPQARVVTSFVGLAKMGLLGLPQDRVYLLNAGQSLDVGDRVLTAVAPPVFDAPETNGLLDSRSRALFSADSFGAVHPSVVAQAKDMDDRALADGMALWAMVDAPWLRLVDASAWRGVLGRIADLGAEVVLGSHLQPARGMMPQLLRNLADVRSAPAFVGPDQQALERMVGAALAEAA